MLVGGQSESNASGTDLLVAAAKSGRRAGGSGTPATTIGAAANGTATAEAAGTRP